MMIPGAFPPHAQCDQGALPPHLTASGSRVWSWAWVTTRPLQRVSSDCPKKNASRWIVYAELWMCVRLINQVVVSRRKRRAVKMMATVVLLFGACWAPFHLVSLLLDYGNTHTHSPNILLLSYLWSSESMRVVSHPGVRVVFYFRSDTCWGQFLQSLHDLNIIMFFF